MDTFIQNALAYYDKNMKKYKKIFNKVDHSKVLLFESGHDLEPDTLELYDKDGNKLLTANYDHIGSYINNLWIWSWATTTVSPNIKLSKKILNYGIDLSLIKDVRFKDYNLINLLLKTELVTSRIFIMNKIQLDIHLAIASYICKYPIIFGVLNKTDNIEVYDYHFLSDIKLTK
jgi:hypothetical protein